MGRAPCCDKANVKKGPWSPEEDAKLKSYIEKHGTGGNWIALPHKIGLKRCGKSCRLRWLNYLRPNIKHGGFTDEEDKIILSLYLSIGSRWSIIAAQLPGRTDNDIKNYWNTKLKKKLLGKQRKDQQNNARKTSSLIMKQEDNTVVDPILYTSSTINNSHISYWPYYPQLTMPSSATITIPNSDNNQYQALNYDNNYPISIMMNTTQIENSLSTLDTCEIMTNPALYNNNEGQRVVGGISMMEGQSSTFPPELEELMSSNQERMVGDGLEYLYGDCGNNNDDPKSETTTCGETSSSGWVDQISSLVSLPKLESDCNVVFTQGVNREEGSFEEHLRYHTNL